MHVYTTANEAANRVDDQAFLCLAVADYVIASKAGRDVSDLKGSCVNIFAILIGKAETLLPVLPLAGSVGGFPYVAHALETEVRITKVREL